MSPKCGAHHSISAMPTIRPGGSAELAATKLKAMFRYARVFCNTPDANTGSLEIQEGLSFRNRLLQRAEVNIYRASSRVAKLTHSGTHGALGTLLPRIVLFYALIVGSPAPSLRPKAYRSDGRCRF
jgi:hypothetical protein